MAKVMAVDDRQAGVIGGMGPHATVDFMARVLAATPAGEDQDHIRMLVDHNPRIPNRQRALNGEGESPGAASGGGRRFSRHALQYGPFMVVGYQSGDQHSIY